MAHPLLRRIACIPVPAEFTAVGCRGVQLNACAGASGWLDAGIESKVAEGLLCRRNRR
jgi:hypothetical protein